MPISEEEKKNLAIPDFNYSMQNKPEFGADISGGSGTQRVNDINAGIIQPDINAGSGLFDTAFSNPYGSGIGLAKPSDTFMPVQNTQQQNQNISSVPANGLNALANSVNGNPDTTNWTSADKAKANEFAIYGNPWNSSMNTPGTNLDNIPTQQQRVASPTQNIQTVGNGQVQTQSQSKTPEFRDGYGNILSTSQTYDASGNLMTRADQEQAKNMYLARELARQAATPDNRLPQQVQIGYTEPTIVKGKHGRLTQIGGSEPTYQLVAPSGPSAGQAAAQALAAFNKITGTIPEYQKDAAGANLANVNSSLLPDKTAAENKQALASANYYNTKAKAESAENDYLMKNADVILGRQKKNTYSSPSSYQEERRAPLPNLSYYQVYQPPPQNTARQRLNKLLGMGR